MKFKTIKAEQFGDALRITIEVEHGEMTHTEKITIQGEILDPEAPRAFHTVNDTHLEAWYRELDSLFADCNLPGIDKNLTAYLKPAVNEALDKIKTATNQGGNMALWMKAEQRAKVIVNLHSKQPLEFAGEKELPVDLDGGSGYFMVDFAEADADRVHAWYTETASEPGGFDAWLFHPDGEVFGRFKNCYPAWYRRDERQFRFGHFGFEKVRTLEKLELRTISLARKENLVDPNTVIAEQKRDYSYTVDRDRILAEAALCTSAALHAQQTGGAWTDAISGRIHGNGLEAWFDFFAGYAIALTSIADRKYMNGVQAVEYLALPSTQKEVPVFAVIVTGLDSTRSTVITEMIAGWLVQLLQGVRDGK